MISNILDNPQALYHEYYLVARGVRLLSWIHSTCEFTEVEDILLKLENKEYKTSTVVQSCQPIPFCVNNKDCYELGYAAHEWVVQVFQDILNSSDISHISYHAIVGMLLGYDGQSIHGFISRVKNLGTPDILEVRMPPVISLQQLAEDYSTNNTGD